MKSTEELIRDFLKAIKEAGKQEPNGIEVVVKGKAPEMVGHGSSGEPTCCKDGDPSGDPTKEKFLEELTPPASGAVRVSFSVSYSAHTGNSLKRVSAHNMTPDGDFLLQPSGRWALTPEEQRTSMSGSVLHNFSICIPCSAFSGSNQKNARFVLFADDANGNTSVQLVGATIGNDQFNKCCKG